MAIGATLAAGNQIGFFPTFPFAGTITVLVGAGNGVFRARVVGDEDEEY